MKPHPIYNSELRNKTKELLMEHLKLKCNTYAAIEAKIGLSQTWIAMFARGELKHTDVGRIETLYNFLAQEPLKV